METLKDILAQRIARSGPVSVATYMAECLLHPKFGYYCTQEPFGAKGDFTTAPEISQMFGELLGLALAQSWLDQGQPAPFLLAELGPGRGTLMADILRATRVVPGFHKAAHIHLIEASPGLRARQKARLQSIECPAVNWHDSIGDLPELPLYLVANEFFDALPIRQFIRTGNGWCERHVGLRDDHLVFEAGTEKPVEALSFRLEDTRPGDMVETRPAATDVVREITARIAARGGVAIITDYGDWRSLGDTLQAMKNHAHVPVLETPGQADLTAHVDFEALAKAAESGTSFTRLTPQGIFLERLGITERARALASQLREEALENHVLAHRRLTHPEEMGTLFKAMAFHRTNTPLPPGFEK